MEIDKTPPTMGRLLLCLALISLAACSPSNLQQSKIKVQIPTEQQLNSGDRVGRQTPAYYSNLCFYVNVRDSATTTPAGVCDLPRQFFAGGVSQGQLLEIEVPYGSDWIFELYGFLRNNSADPCPAIPSPVPSTQISKVSRIGSSTPQDINEPTESVDVVLNLPASPTNIVAQLGLPASCFGATVPTMAGGVRAGSFEGTGTNFKVSSQVHGMGPNKFTGTNFNLRSRVRSAQ